MIDKIQKIREKVEKLKSKLIRGACASQIAMETYCKEEAYNEVLAILDSMKEEPVKDRIAFKAIPRLLDMIEPTDRAKAYIAKLADTLGVEGYSTDAKIIGESLKMMNGEKVPMATMNEKPVSDGLEEASKNYALNNTPWDDCKDEIQESFKAGANWKKHQMIAKAIDGKVIANGMGEPILHLWDKGKHLIDKKVKVIVIEED